MTTVAILHVPDIVQVLVQDVAEAAKWDVKVRVGGPVATHAPTVVITVVTQVVTTEVSSNLF